MDLKQYEYYRTENGVLYNADCLSIMPLLEPVDLVLTDPPYDKFTHLGALHKTEKDREFGIEFDCIENISEIVCVSMSVCKAWLLFFCGLEMLGRYQSASPDNYVRGGIWDRICNAPQISGDRPAQGGEGIAILHRTRKNMKWNGHGKAAIWRAMVERGRKKHPTQKPLLLFIDLLCQFSNIGDSVLDPFFGSGTTAIACEKTNRSWVGIESSEKYCGIAAERIDAETKQLQLFN